MKKESGLFSRAKPLARKFGKESFLAGAILLARMRGGIFRWYDQGRQVVNDQGVTDSLHPNNNTRGLLIKNGIRGAQEFSKEVDS